MTVIKEISAAATSTGAADMEVSIDGNGGNAAPAPGGDDKAPTTPSTAYTPSMKAGTSVTPRAGLIKPAPIEAATTAGRRHGAVTMLLNA